MMSDDLNIEVSKEGVKEEVEIKKEDEKFLNVCVNGNAQNTPPNAFNTPRKLVDYSSESEASSVDSESDSSDSLPLEK